MPEGRFAGVVILAEDGTQRRFIRSWLVEHVYVEPRDIVNSKPFRGGSGKQFVSEQFAVEVAFHRVRAAKRGSMLIAVIDVDTGDTQAHYKNLLDQVLDRGSVFVFVPKRNIETWLHQLNGNDTNEVQSYKMTYKKDPTNAIRIAGLKFLELVRSRSIDGLLPSLALGVREAGRMPKFHDPARR